MNIYTAFEQRRDALRAQLEQAQRVEEAVSCCTMALEQMAGELAQNEQDELARQRQQAVLALARRAPLWMRTAQAQGRLVLSPKKNEPKHTDKVRLGAQAVGAALLAALAVYELIEGRETFALMQAAGAALLALGGKKEAQQAEGAVQAEGVLCVDAAQTLRTMGELCQAADVCVSDLALIARESGAARLSGTVDDAMLDLLCALMEAKASGREALAMRSLEQAEQYLRMLGMETVFYSAAQAELFDLLPTLGEARTIRPALLKDGRLLRRGVAACSMERSVRA